MKRTLVVLVLMMAFMLTSAMAVDVKSDLDKSPVLKIKTVKKSEITKIEAAKNVVDVYFNDFETEQLEVLQLGEGPAFIWDTTNPYSGAYSYWVADDEPMDEANAVPTETAIVTPPITLPADFDGYAPKVLEMSYYFDVETPNTSFDGGVYDVWQTEIETAFPGDNLWHQSTSKGFEGGSSWWMGSPGTGTYGANTNQELISPVLDLSAAAGAVMLTFKNAPNSEPAYDYSYLEVSSDGGLSWTQLERWDEEHDPVAWFDAEYDISAFASDQTVIRWRFVSDGGTESADSWRIDNVQVTDGTTVFLFDDGGDTATALIATEHPVSWVRMHYDYDDEDRFGAGWFIEDPSTIFNGSLDLRDWAGETIRLRILVTSDGYNRLGLAPGAGFFFDDLRVYGQGVAEVDGAVAGVGNLFGAAPGQPLGANVFVENQGLTALNGPIIWYGSIKDAAGNEVAKPIGKWDDTIEPGDVVAVPTLAGEWTPMGPGAFTFEVISLSVTSDGYLPNNELIGDDAVAFDVMGYPYTQVLYAESFDDPSKPTIEDFGWTVMNDGGNDLTGANVNTWELSDPFEWFWGFGALELTWAWGNIDVGPDMDATNDSSEVLEEWAVTPPIDVSKVSAHNTLGVQYYVYYRPGHPGVGAPFGEAVNSWNVEWSANGTDWAPAYVFVNDDSTYEEPTDRLPHMIYGGAPVVSYLSTLDVDVTAALRAAKMSGSDNVWVRFGVKCEDSYFVGAVLDQVIVFAGIAQPALVAVDDVAGDQGGNVHLTFAGSANDLVFDDGGVVGDPVSVPVAEYEVWRGYEMAGATVTATFASFKDMLDNVKAPSKSNVYAVEDHHMVWDYVATIPAAAHKMYGYVAPTLADGQETAFMVVARTLAIDIWSMSAPMVGMSEDNLAPTAPTALLVNTEEAAGANSLQWDAAYTPVDDVNFYTVYRDAEVLATTAELVYVDNTAEVGTEYTYTVSATDFAGNESDKSGPGSVVTSVDSKSAVPTDYALKQNYPNPFNPTTTVEFALPNAGDVTLTIFNTTGQAITTLYNGYMDAGYHKVNWNAAVNSAGLYFLEMRSGEYTKLIKMTLVK